MTAAHFLDDEECDRLIVWGGSAGYGRSVGVRNINNAEILEEVVSVQRGRLPVRLARAGGPTPHGVRDGRSHTHGAL